MNMIKGYGKYAIKEGIIVNAAKETPVKVIDGSVTLYNDNGDLTKEDVAALLAENPVGQATEKKADEKPKAEDPVEKATGKANTDTKKSTPVAKKDSKKPSKEKKVGVIQTIYNAISESGAEGITEDQILAKLTKAFPKKEKDSMSNTVRAQIRSKKRPVRMEKEKKVTFVITEKKEIRYYSIKK